MLSCEEVAAALGAPLGMDLEQWRQEQGLTYEELAVRLGFPSASQTRRYAVGEEALKDERLQTVLNAAPGQIGLYALHKRRVEYLRRAGTWSLPRKRRE